MTGIAGVVLVTKTTGAMVSAGHDLEEIVHVSRLVINDLGSIGVSLNRMHVPSISKV